MRGNDGIYIYIKTIELKGYFGFLFSAFPSEHAKRIVCVGKILLIKYAAYNNKKRKIRERGYIHLYLNVTFYEK